MKATLRLPMALLVALGIGGIVALVIAATLAGWIPLDGAGDAPRPAEESAPRATPVAEAADSTAAAPSDQSQLEDSGISDQRVLFGQSAAFSGPAQELGKNMRLGILAAFQEANRRGGVHGRQLELAHRDDAYEPEAAIANTQELIKQEGVFALIGAVGTPTSRSATPVAAEAGVPYVAPFTGAAFLRDPEWRNIINLRASYYQETEEMVARLTKDLGIERIAVIYQDDSYGRAGYRGVLGALGRRSGSSVELAAIGVYPRNTTAVKAALLDLRQGNPEAVIIIGAYEPVAALIAWARHTGLNPLFLTVSFVGSNALARELGSAGAGVLVTQVVPFPTDSSLPIVAAYHRALAAYQADAVPGFVSLEGYLAGRLAIASLDSCGREVSRACFLDSLRRTDSIDIDGFELRYGEDDNQGSDEVFLTVIGRDGRYHAIETLRDMEQ